MTNTLNIKGITGLLDRTIAELNHSLEAEDSPVRFRLKHQDYAIKNGATRQLDIAIIAEFFGSSVTVYARTNQYDHPAAILFTGDLIAKEIMKAGLIQVYTSLSKFPAMNGRSSLPPITGKRKDLIEVAVDGKTYYISKSEMHDMMEIVSPFSKTK